MTEQQAKTNEIKKSLSDTIRKSLKDKNKTTPADPLIDEEVENLKADRALKKSYAKWFIGILIGQLAIMNIVFILVGLGFLTYDKWSLNLYMGGTMAEVFGVIFVITRNLFRNKSS